MSNNPPVYTESPLLYQKINAPEFVNKRLLIVTYYNMGYDYQYISLQLSVSEKYCNKIINIFQSFGIKALLKRDFGLRKKKEQKKFNSYELSLIRSLTMHQPPKNQNKWTYEIVTNLINYSGLFENQTSLCALRSIMINQRIDLNAWKNDLIDTNDVNFRAISDILSLYETVEEKNLKDYELDITYTEEIIHNLILNKKSVNIINVFTIYKQRHNLPKLTIYKFSKLLKNNFPEWKEIKQFHSKNHHYYEKKITLSCNDKLELIKISSNPSLPKIVRMRANICLELEKGNHVSKVEEVLRCSRSMIYRIYNQYKTIGIKCVEIKKRETKKAFKTSYDISSIKKYPNLLSVIQKILSKNPNGKSKWTLLEITTELKNQHYNISNTSVSKLLRFHNIKY